MTINQRYAEHLGEALIHTPLHDRAYQRFAELQAKFEMNEPLYVDRELTEYRENQE